MAIDLIKEYLVGIGFQVNASSLDSAKNSMGEAENTIKKFNKSSQNGFGETNDSLQSLFQLMKISNGTLGKLFPELQGPVKGLIADILILKKLFSDITNIKVKPEIDENKKVKNNEFRRTSKKAPQDKTKNNESSKKSKKEHTDKSVNTRDQNKIITENVSNTQSKQLSVMPKDTKLTDTSENLVDSVLDAKEATKDLASEGGNAFKLFSASALGPIGAVIVSMAALTLATKAIIDTLSDLAKQDIEYEKLSRQLWTTKENAKEVDMALKTLGVSMQDLWLSPTLLKQFNELRKDSAALKLPPEYTQNLKIIQGVGAEFSRLKQLAQLALQWICNYILKYISGPVDDFKQGMKEFNNWLIKNIPGAAKTIGSVIGIVLRIILDIGKALGFIFSIQYKIINFISGLIPDSLKKILKVIAAIGILIMMGPVGAIIALIAALDDLFTYLKGGKSVIGSFFDNLFGEQKDKNPIQNAGSKVKEFNNTNANALPKTYSTTNNMTNTSTTANSNNKINNQNTFNIYGGNDTKSTAKTVSKNLTGVNTRNLQGVH